MSVIRLPQQYANNRFAEQIREASQTIGELVIFVKIHHPWVDDTAHCPRCWDDFYKEATDKSCPVCGGSGFSSSEDDQGIAAYGRVWAIISDNIFTDNVPRQYGQWSPDERIIEVEGGVEPNEHDYVIRVKRWSSDFRPLKLGDRYCLDNPYPTVSLRSGNEPAQAPGQNVVGYRFKAHLLRGFQENFDFPPDTPIPQFPIP